MRQIEERMAHLVVAFRFSAAARALSRRPTCRRPRATRATTGVKPTSRNSVRRGRKIHDVIGRLVAAEMHDPILEQIVTIDRRESLEPMAQLGLREREMRRAVVERETVAVQKQSARLQDAVSFGDDAASIVVAKIMRRVIGGDDIEAGVALGAQSFERVGLDEFDAPRVGPRPQGFRAPAPAFWPRN